MKLRGFTRRHPITSAIALFLVLALTAKLAVGIYLGTRSDFLVPVIESINGRPDSVGDLSLPSVRCLIRLDSGIAIWEGPSDAYAGRGVVLGSVRMWSTRRYVRGIPRVTHERWTVNVDSITPASDGPPAADERAWRRFVVAAYAGTPQGSGHEIPAAIWRGDASALRWYPFAIVQNAIEALRARWVHSAACILIAAALSIGLGTVWFRRRARPGQCERCGYNVSALPTSKCPECGSQTAPS